VLIRSNHLTVREATTMKKSKGFRSRTRRLLRKPPRKRGLPPIGKMLREYQIGDRVHIIIEPSVHKGTPHPRFHGKTGVVIGKRGRAYMISVRDGKAEKIIFARSEHLSPA